MNSQHERENSIDAALEIAYQTIAKYSLRAHHESYGDRLITYRCQLINDEQQHIFYGFGKGIGLQSKASAYYEALEHFLIHHHASEIANNSDTYRFHEGYQATIPHIEYETIGSNQPYFQPLFLFNPRYGKYPAAHDRFDYSKHSWMAHDTGLASGTSITEASIHALNELIERDAHSLFLIKHFLKRNGHQPRLINKLSLPATLADIVVNIETTYHDDLMIFDITSDIGIPTFYVSMTKQNRLIQPSGCGTSLNAQYALERALLESLQPLHVQNHTLHENQQQIINVLSETPLLQRAAIADVASLSEMAITIQFNDVPSFHSVIRLDDQLHFITQAIQNKGISIYRHIIEASENGFSCVKLLIPDFEQFHLVQIGKRILPAKRGMMVI